jgi:hypothetical protein
MSFYLFGHLEINHIVQNNCKNSFWRDQIHGNARKRINMSLTLERLMDEINMSSATILNYLKTFRRII